MKEYSKYNDDQLVALLRQGNESAFTEIYNRFQGLLYVHAYKKLKDNEEAKDVIHELFATLWSKKANLSYQGGLTNYLYAAVRNRIINVTVKRTIESKYLATLKNFSDEDKIQSDDKIREEQLAEIIEKEINNLPDKMREIFLLSRKQGWSHKEIAVELGISTHTVRTQIKNSLRIIRNKLGLILYILYLLKKI